MRFGFLVTVMLLTGFVRLVAAAPDFILTIKTERADALYAENETVMFVITLTHGGQPVEGAEVDWKISKDGMPPVTSGRAVLEKGEARVTGSLPEPGFLQCRAEYAGATENGGKPLVALAGAGISPRKIRPSLPPPDDFDAFWAAQKAALAKVPANVRLTPVSGQDASLAFFDAQVDCVDGVPVSGYLVRPADAKPKSLPAILTVHGAGVGSARIEAAANWARQGVLALDINAHGLPNGQPQAWYDSLREGELKDYRIRGRTARDTIYFRGMFLRVLRALDVLAAQPEWDGRTLVIQGSSQGGAQAIAGAALDPRVTFFVAGVPAMCDHSALLAGRAAGWPKMVPADAAGKPHARALEAARYYDMVNFASRIRRPGFFTVGFIDTTCPPTSVYAAFNALRGTGRIFDDLAAGHTNTPEAMKRMRQAIRRHIQDQGKLFYMSK
ncbi:acetyl xylan esterase [Opitutaceae bacterium TAV5]|nr:acetyl xylan esterase [Opitutaceae bacterium TAV5]